MDTSIGFCQGCHDDDVVLDSCEVCGCDYCDECLDAKDRCPECTEILPPTEVTHGC